MTESRQTPYSWSGTFATPWVCNSSRAQSQAPMSCARRCRTCLQRPLGSWITCKQCFGSLLRCSTAHYFTLRLVCQLVNLRLLHRCLCLAIGQMVVSCRVQNPGAVVLSFGKKWYVEFLSRKLLAGDTGCRYPQLYRLLLAGASRSSRCHL